MITMLWSKSNTGAIVQPEPSFLRLLVRNLQPLSLPEPFDAAIAD